MLNMDMPKGSASAKKVAAHPRNKRTVVNEHEQLYLVRKPASGNGARTHGDAGLEMQALTDSPAQNSSATTFMSRYVAATPANGGHAQSERDLLLQRYADKLVVNSFLTRRVVSFQASKRIPFYRWLKYKEAFSPELVDYLFDATALPQDNEIQLLDPFAGTGTTLTRAATRMWSATGIELMPIGACTLKARFVADRVDLSSFQRALELLNKLDWTASDPGWHFPHLPITKSAFPRRSETEMSAYLRFANGFRGSDVRYLLWFAALSVLEDVSFTRKDGQYLRWDYRSGRKLAKHFDKGPVPSFSTAVRQRLREFAADLERRNGGNFSAHAHVIEGSCLFELPKLPHDSVDLVVTSPPYCNRYDYTRTYALELAFCGLGEDEVRTLRQTLLSATVENKSKKQALKNYYIRLGAARRSDRIEQAYDNQAALHEALGLLRSARDRGELSNKNVPMLVENYFLEMAHVVFEIARLLRRGGYAFIVNDNVRYHGEEVPVDLILCDFAEAAGLMTDRIWVLPRGKGNSSQQMGRWGRHELRKCVYCWRKR